jgi:DNA polymerase
MAACERYLIRQIELINPAVICALGRIAAHGLLKKGASLGVLRQGVHYYNDIPVAVTYHPAALLRNPNLKREAWEDLQAIRKLYDEAIREDE